MGHVSQELAFELASLQNTLILGGQLNGDLAQLLLVLPQCPRFSTDEEGCNCDEQESDQACCHHRTAAVATGLFGHSVQYCRLVTGDSIQRLINRWHQAGFGSSYQGRKEGPMWR